MAHKWADWLHTLCRLQGPQRCREGDKISNGPQVGGLATKPRHLGVPPRFKVGDKISSAQNWADWLHTKCH